MDRRRRRVRQAARRPPHAGAEHPAVRAGRPVGAGVRPPERRDPHHPAPRRQGAVLGPPRRPGGLHERARRHPARVGPGLAVQRRDPAAAAGRRHHGQPVLRRARLPPRRAAAGRGRPPHRRRRHRLRGHLRPPRQHLDAAARHERRTLVPHGHLARRRPGARDLGQRRGPRHHRGERRPADHRRRGLGAHRRLRRAAALPAHARRPGRARPHGGLERHDLPARHPRRRRLDPARAPGRTDPGSTGPPRCTRPAR